MKTFGTQISLMNVISMGSQLASFSLNCKMEKQHINLPLQKLHCACKYSGRRVYFGKPIICTILPVLYYGEKYLCFEPASSHLIPEYMLTIRETFYHSVSYV
jgi:hypothetical protein